MSFLDKNQEGSIVDNWNLIGSVLSELIDIIKQIEEETGESL